MPPQHLIRNLMTRMDAMQAEITELKQQISRDKLEDVPAVSEGPDVMFTLPDKRNVFVKRYIEKKFIVKQYGSTAECDNAKFEHFQNAYDRMEVAGVRTSLGNMKILGMSSRNLTWYKQALDAGRPPMHTTVPKEVSVRRAPIIVPVVNVPVNPTKKRKFIALREHVKVVKGLGSTVVKTAQIYKEDIERFGEDKIIPSADTCTGRIVDDVKFTPQLYRDVCIDGKADVDEFPVHPKVGDLIVQ